MQVRDALCKKVSRERVGVELEGMFNGALAPLPCLAVAAGAVAMPGQQHALARIQEILWCLHGPVCQAASPVSAFAG